MNLELFIAKRIHFNNDSKKTMSRPAVRIAIIGIALGLAVMLIAVSVIVGFKREVRNQIIGFGSHIQISNYEDNNSFEARPITTSDSLRNAISNIQGVLHVQNIATKPGIIKTDTDFEGVVLKGIDNTFDWDFFVQNLKEGTTIQWGDSLVSNQAVISQNIANRLQLKLNDSFLTYFIGNEIRARKFKVTGIYQTNFIEYDKLYILADIRHIQQLNAWNNNEISQLEILTQDFNTINETNDAIFMAIGNKADASGNFYRSRTIRDLAPQIFDWLDMLDMNAWVILVLMLAVAGFNMISGLLILILERTSMIGTLKALGAKNWSIRKIFLYHSAFLIGKGMLWGNLFGITLILLQYFLKIIPLDAEMYYVDAVPVAIDPMIFIIINLATAIISILMLVAPSYLITRIQPAKSIQFD